MIRQTYDLDAGALYVTVADAPVARTIEVDPATLVDVDTAGGLVGVEVIRPGYAWPLQEILDRFAVPVAERAELRAYFSSPTWPTFSAAAAR